MSHRRVWLFWCGLALAAAVAVTCARENTATVTGPPSNPPPPPAQFQGAPTVDAGPDLRVYAGSAAELWGRIVPKANQTQYHWTVTWGDGKADSGALAANGIVAATHTYTATGAHPIKLSAAGPAGASDVGSDSLTATVDQPGTPEVLIGAGDIAECGLPHAAKTAALIDTVPGIVFTLGDNAYELATPDEYTACYDPTWGKFKQRTRPTMGNHEYEEYPQDSTANGYFGYFGAAAHEQPRGWYSYDVGAWHIIVLNSDFEESQAAGRAVNLQTELTWLKSDLTSHPAQCTLAMWHHPRFSSGTAHGSSPMTQPFWQALYDAGADVVLVGHEHNYERFAPMAPDGTLDRARGIREFVSGTGGGGYDPLDTTKVGHVGNSETGAMEHGVLKLTLTPGAYHWQFMQELPPLFKVYSDSGTAACH